MTGLRLKWGGANRVPTDINLKWGGNRRPSGIYVRKNGGWIKVWPLVATVAITGNTFISVPNGAYNFARGSAITGGVGPFTYSWNLTSAFGITINGSNTGSSLGLTSNGRDIQRLATVNLTITDQGNGNATSSASVSVTVQHS